jgi:hypothetical protein
MRVFALIVLQFVANVTAASVITVGLSASARPLPTLLSLVDHLQASEASVESRGLSKVQAAMENALQHAKTQIESTIAASKTSFLGASDSDSVLIRPLSGPGVATENLQEVTNLEAARSNVESHEIDQAAAEFDALTTVVVSELRKALRGGSSFVDVQVQSGTVSFPTVEDILRGMEHHRDASESSTRGKMLDLQIQFVRQLNSIISRALR